MILQFIILGFLLILSALFSSTETAFTSLSQLQIQEMEEEKGRAGKRIKKMMLRPDILLTTILIGNNLVNIAASALTTTLVISIWDEYVVGFATGILTLLILIFGEVVPKQIALVKNSAISLFMVYPVWLLSLVLRPIILFINIFSRILTRPIKGKDRKPLTLDGLLRIVTMAENIGIVESYEKEMLKNLFRFGDISIQNIITHRTEVFSLDKEKTIKQAIPEILNAGYSRIPLYSGNPEHIQGLVHMRQVLKALSQGKENLRLADLQDDVLFVPHSKACWQLFLELKEAKQKMAVVMDEYGGLAGIITREDLIEEIFGELYDENESREAEKIIHLEKNTYRIQGDTSCHLMKEQFGIELDHGKHVATVAGFIIEQLNRIPSMNDEIRIPEGQFKIESVFRNRIGTVVFQVNPAAIKKLPKKSAIC